MVRRLVICWLTVGLVCLLGAVPALGRVAFTAATVPLSSVPAQVVFNASGTYTVDETYTGGGHSCTTHDTGVLTWAVSYDSYIADGKLADAPGTLATAVGPGNLSLTKSGGPECNYFSGGCTAALQAGGYPQLTVQGGDPARLELQSLTAPLSFSGCAGVDDRAYMGRDVYLLQRSLPGATTGVVTVPASVLAQHNSNYTASVDSGSAPEQVPAACTGIAPGTGNTACSASLTWSGTVLVRVCATPGEKTSLPYCLARKKDQAHQAAHDMRAIALAYNPPCPGGVHTAVCKVAQGLGRTLIFTQASDTEKIAKDPPDPAYTRAPRPMPPKLRKLSRITRLLPAYARWLTSLASAVGYESALDVALNRQSGAAGAEAQGTPGAADAVVLQRNAIMADARQAATRLARADRLAGAAARQLKARTHSRAPLGRLAGAERRMVALLKAIAQG